MRLFTLYELLLLCLEAAPCSLAYGHEKAGVLSDRVIEFWGARNGLPGENSSLTLENVTRTLAGEKRGGRGCGRD